MKNNVLVLFLALISASLFAGTYSGGSGTSGAPYQIATLDDLQELSTPSADWAAGIYFIQTANIDATATSTWNSGAGMATIGTSITKFFGSYDGQGFTISELTINRPGILNIGMFGYAKYAKLSNIHLVNVHITGGQFTGGLAGYFYGAESEVPIGVITNCTTTGSVTSSSNFVGGLVGAESRFAVIQQCSSTCTVVGALYGGGLVGHCTQASKIYNSYAGGTVNIPRYSGGLIAYMDPGNGVAVTNCYSYTAVSGTSDKGGFIGRYVSGTTSGSFWDTEASGLTNAAGIGSPVGITGLTTADMKTESNYTSAGWDFVGETTNGTNDYWAFSAGNNNGYPYLVGIYDATWSGNTDSDWNNAANWIPETIPTANAKITIPAEPLRQPVINQAPASPAVCYTLTIALGAELIIAPGKALTVNGTLTNNALNSGLYLQSGADGTGSLIHNTDNVPATIETYITGSSNLTVHKFHFVSIPAKEINPTSNLFWGSYLYKLDASLQEPENFNYYGKWVSLGTSMETPLYLDKGYMVYSPFLQDNYSFMANLNNGDFSCAVAGHAGTYTFNLVPNPYPSAINWGEASGWIKSAGIGGTCYVWGSNAGNYEYLSITGSPGIIPVGQAFIVMVSDEDSPMLTVKNAARVHSSQEFYKSTQEISNQLSIKADANGFSDVTSVAFNEEATDDFDLQTDGIKMFGLEDAPQLYTLSAGKKYSVNNLPGFQDQRIVDMNFETQFTGEVTLSFEGLVSFDPSINIYLKDELTNQTINLRNQPVYTFSHNPENAANRFKLVFGGTIGIDEPLAGTRQMWINGNTVYLNTPELNGQQAQVEVFNPAGQRLLAKSLVLEDFTTFDLNLKGFVIVKLTAGQEVMTMKGILMK